MSNNVFGNLQKVGKALMTPVAALPIAAILMSIHVVSKYNAPIINSAAGAILGHLAILFAVGVAFGLAKNNHGAAALAGLIGYYVLVAVIPAAALKFGVVEEPFVLENQILLGMFAGISAGVLYNKFHTIKLPQWLAFFGGKRFVPIITTFAMLIAGTLISFIWPAFENGITGVGNWVIGAGTLGVFVYGVLNRLLIPLGLHHVINSVVWFVFGTYENAEGVVSQGEIHRFLAGDPTAGQFLAGFYPIMMFALPAVAFAMYTCADKQYKKATAGFVFSLALTSFVTGITEPIEFCFIFLSPILLAVHALLTGLSLAVCQMLGCLHGFGFSAGLTDYLLLMPKATKGLLLIPVGLVMGTIYYLVFVFAIKKFNIATPGRAGNIIDEDCGSSFIEDKGIPYVAAEYLRVIGGKSNIVDIDACITRLRLTLKDSSVVTEEACKALGANGVIRPTKTTVQIIVGTQAELVAEKMKDLM